MIREKLEVQQNMGLMQEFYIFSHRNCAFAQTTIEQVR